MRGDPRVRLQIAREAAKLMVEEGVRSYFDAKRIAGRRVLRATPRERDLPSNGEIRDQVLALVAWTEGEDRVHRLFLMRVEALVVLRALDAWHPRLIGSVWSGHARAGSDIDVHLFGELDAITTDLDARGWRYTPREVLIRTSTGFRTYHHLERTDRPFVVELSVYPLSERRVTTRSSVDGRPIDRVSAARLAQRLRDEHPDAFAAWCAEHGEG
ncbi:MAG: nucleotidyltransferase [Myxococcota bacterium]